MFCTCVCFLLQRSELRSSLRDAQQTHQHARTEVDRLGHEYRNYSVL
jgi:hypothetical protein